MCIRFSENFPIPYVLLQISKQKIKKPYMARHKTYNMWWQIEKAKRKGNLSRVLCFFWNRMTSICKRPLTATILIVYNYGPPFFVQISWHANGAPFGGELMRQTNQILLDSVPNFTHDNYFTLMVILHACNFMVCIYQMCKSSPHNCKTNLAILVGHIG